MAIETCVQEYVAANRGTTFIELEFLLSSIMEVKGNIAIFFEGNDSITIWPFVSQEFADLIVGMLDRKELYLHPTSWRTYVAEGRVPDMPLAKSARRYKDVRWLPVVVNTYPMKGEK